MDKNAIQGWLPVEIELSPEPAVIAEATVRWMEFGDAPLCDPFFPQTVRNLRQASPPAAEIDTRLDSLFRMAARLPAVLPAGFIFHVSHCGSTLVANALKTAPGTVVAAEATPMTRLAQRYPEPPGRYLAARWERTRRGALEALFTLFAHYRTGSAERLVVKFASSNLASMKTVRAFWPDVPCVVLVRSPAEVMASALSEKGWLGVKQHPDLARVLFGLEGLSGPVEEMSDEEFCARVLGRLFAAAIEAVDRNSKVIDYEDLTARRIRDIAEVFGIELTADPAGLKHVFQVYSKDPARFNRFYDDRERKRSGLSREASAAAHRWAMPAYSELRGMGFW